MYMYPIFDKGYLEGIKVYMEAMIALYLLYIIERVAIKKIISNTNINGTEMNKDRSTRDLNLP